MTDFVVYNQLFFYNIHFQYIILTIFLAILHNNLFFMHWKIVEIFVQKKSFWLLRGVQIFGILAV